jgi:hypothetical protein
LTRTTATGRLNKQEKKEKEGIYHPSALYGVRTTNTTKK